MLHDSVLKIRAIQHDCDVFFNNDNTLLLLPTFFSLHISKIGRGFSLHSYINNNRVAQERFELEELSKTTVKIYINRLHQFLSWLSDYDRSNKSTWLAKHNNLPPELINKEYIDSHLIEKCGAGKSAIMHHESALQYYYNYLAVCNLSLYKYIHHSPKHNILLEYNTRERTSLKYLSKALRLAMYENTTSLRNEIILRNGGELGLRTRENLGLLLNDFEHKGKREAGLKTLWHEMKINDKPQSFRFLLQGKYSKGLRGRGGKSREIFIPRRLLKLYHKYFEQERPYTESNHLLVNNAANAAGAPVQRNKGSDVFAEIRRKVMELQRNGSAISSLQMLESDHTYHCLRHSFATDKFEQFCKEDNVHVEQASADSRAFLRVARLMGHSIATQTTARYIQLVLDKRSIDE